MIPLESIITYFETHGNLRRSQRKTIAALTLALMGNSFLGIAAIGHSLAWPVSPPPNMRLNGWTDLSAIPVLARLEKSFSRWIGPIPKPKMAGFKP